MLPGDRLGLLPTSYEPNAVDDVFITTYDNTTGAVTLNTSLSYYHWGAAESTGNLYNGVDIRGEVILLNRNVKIQGEDIESWGAQIVTSDTIEADMTMRYGSMVLDNVEIFNSS